MAGVDVKHHRKKKLGGCSMFYVPFRCMVLKKTGSGSADLPKGIKDESCGPSYVRKDQNQNQADRIIPRPGPNYKPRRHAYHYRAPERSTGLSQVMNQGQEITHPKAAVGISSELEFMIQDYKRSAGCGGALVRASSGNLMLYRNLGNLRPQPDSNNMNIAVAGKNVDDDGNNNPESLFSQELPIRVHPEQLKLMGNEEYMNGRFDQALALYNAAISMAPNKVTYRCRRTAALLAMDRVLEAALEGREAIRIAPFHQQAHNRLATIYTRLGEAENAMHHFRQAVSEADLDALDKAKKVEYYLSKCTKAKRRKDWNALIEETGHAIEAGADSAPLVYGLRAEALLKLNKHGAAIKTMEDGPNFDIDACTRFFGPIGSASFLVYQAQVDLVAGRFDEALAAAERAKNLDPNNKETSTILKRSRAVAISTHCGNQFFAAKRYMEASIAYGEALSQDPYNSAILCKRAACNSKLGLYEQAIEDCDTALRVHSSYSKARRRRANCYAEIGRWDACLQDCEELLKENPSDEKVVNMMEEATMYIENQTDQFTGHELM